MIEQRGLLREGFFRLKNYKRILWWMFIVNLVLATLGAFPAAKSMHMATAHSLQARRLVDSFDIGAFSSLASDPEVNLFSTTGHSLYFIGAFSAEGYNSEVKLFSTAANSLHFALLFMLFSLFLTGGVLEAYRANRKLTTREFFEACGNYFWRWIRLLLMMAIILIPIVFLGEALLKYTGTLLEDSPSEKAGFWFFFASAGVIGFLLICVRLWFDIAQVRTVVEEDSGMLCNLRHALMLTFGNFPTLFWMYLRLAVLGWIAFGLGLWIWARRPAAGFEWTILLLELVVLWGFAMRLWQRACEMVWYQRKFMAPAAIPVPAPRARLPIPS
jgi:hypothetical protein